MSRYGEALRAARRTQCVVLVLGCAGLGWMIGGQESAAVCALIGLAIAP